MEATPAQERYMYAVDFVRDLLKTGVEPEFISDTESPAGYRRWKMGHDMLSTQKELLEAMDQLERRFRDARPYIQGSSGLFDPRGIVRGDGAKIDVLCAILDAKIQQVVQAEIDLGKEQDEG